MSETPLNLTITPFGADRPVTFKTFDDAQTWLKGQQDKWQRFHQHANRHNIIRGHQQAISTARAGLSQAVGEQSTEKASRAMRTLEHPPFLSADAPCTDLITEAIEVNDLEGAIIIYRLWAGQSHTQNLNQLSTDLAHLMKAAALWRNTNGPHDVEAANYRKDMNARLSKWETTFKSLSERGTEWLDKTEKDSAAVLTRQAEIEDSLRTLHAGSQDRLESLGSQHEEKLTALHSAHEEKLTALHQTQSEALDQLNQTYLEHLRLKAPAEFWTQKAKKHAKAAIRWLWGLMGCIAVGLIGSTIFLWKNFYSLIDHVSGKESGTTAIVLLVLPALLYLTLVRVAHKSYRDETRHAVDAEQRATLAKTYLALVKDDDGRIEPGERLLALHALFRGSSLSDSPDDTPPVNSLEAIIQSLKPKA